MSRRHYVTKPFSPRELMLRIRSVLRRAAPAAAAVPTLLSDDDLTADTGRRIARLSGQPLPLTVREFDLLAFLMRHPARVVNSEVCTRALSRLTARQRLAVDCVYFVGLSMVETAAVMGCVPGTLKSTLADARTKLRSLLEVAE